MKEECHDGIDELIEASNINCRIGYKFDNTHYEVKINN